MKINLMTQIITSAIIYVNTYIFLRRSRKKILTKTELNFKF
jgi:hypothetical protein